MPWLLTTKSMHALRRKGLDDSLAKFEMSTRDSKATYLGTRYITDGKVFGLVKLTTDNEVCIVDRITGKQHKLNVRTVRRMTLDEQERYNDTPSYCDPTKGQIKKRTAEIRGSWDHRTRTQRLQPRPLPIGDFNREL